MLPQRSSACTLFGMRRTINQPSDTSRRTCTRCGATKTVESGFYRCKPGSMNDKTYGCAMPCIECNRKRCRGYKRSDALRARDAAAKRKPEARQADRARHRSWYATPEGKAYVREYGAKYYAENGEAMRAKSRERYKTDERRRESVRKSNIKRRARPEVRQAKNEAHAARKKTERGRLLSRMHRKIRRARLASTVCTLTDKQWLALVEAYGGKCAYCGLAAPMTIDHIQAIARGGEHSLINVVPACKRCNQVKGVRPLMDALQKLNATRVDFLKRQGLALFAMRTQGVSE